MEHLRIFMAELVSYVGGHVAACTQWRVGRSTLFGWLTGKHPPSLDALQRVIASVPPDTRDSIYMAIEADAGAADRKHKTALKRKAARKRKAPQGGK